ncbi:MAG: helix-turn-helix domain-containing protein [Acidimicrobiales bacterium]
MVHLQVVADDRRERARDRKRRRFLEAASRVIDERGLDGLTMQAIAEHLDCAVGTIYTYFESKAALLAALQANAVDTLLASHRSAAAGWQTVIEREELEPTLACLVQLQAFGGFFCAASVVFADEFHLQRLLLTQRPPGTSAADLRRPMSVLARLFEIPRTLLDEAVGLEVLEPGDNLERVVRWIAALDGVLLLDELAGVDRHLFRAQHHGRALTADLLVGWGADRADVEVAASHVDRLAAIGPLAPPPDGPGFD